MECISHGSEYELVDMRKYYSSSSDSGCIKTQEADPTRTGSTLKALVISIESKNRETEPKVEFRKCFKASAYSLPVLIQKCPVLHPHHRHPPPSQPSFPSLWNPTPSQPSSKPSEAVIQDIFP